MDVAVSNWRGRRVFVTGGVGFLGNAVVKQMLARGAEVIGLVRDRAAAAAFTRHRLAGRIHIIHGRSDDLFRVHSALAVHEVQAAFHFPSSDGPPLDHGLVTVLEAVRKYNPVVPVVSSRPDSAGSLLTSPAPLGVARFDELFGPDPESRGLVASTIAALLAGERVLPDDRDSRDFVPVADAARACLLLAEAVAKHPVPHVREATFRTGWQFTERELAASIRDAIAARPPLVSLLAQPANPLGWSPSLNFAEALADTVAWYRAQAARAPGVRLDRARIAA